MQLWTEKQAYKLVFAVKRIYPTDSSSFYFLYCNQLYLFYGKDKSVWTDYPGLALSKLCYKNIWDMVNLIKTNISEVVFKQEDGQMEDVLKLTR